MAMEDQKRMIDLDREFLALRERECMLRAQLKAYCTQQGQIGLKVCNIEQEMQLLDRRIVDVRKERESAYNCLYAAREKEAKGKKGKR